MYDSILSGFAVELPEKAAEALSRNPNVRFIEENAVVRVSGVSASQGTSGDPEQGLWHLDRSDERQIDDGLDGAYGYCSTGQGVIAYVVDTGIYAAHPEFGGRVKNGPDFTDDLGTADNPCRSPSSFPPELGGHGTAVASVLGGKTYGVAKSASLVPVRVFDCSVSPLGTNARVLSGLNWIKTPQPSGSTNIQDGNPDYAHRPAVINMSFWCPEGDPLDSLRIAIEQLEQEGFVIFAAANNFPEDPACNRFPASNARSNGGKVITVGGTMVGANGSGPAGGDLRDYRWRVGTSQDQGSSYGGCVDIWAPAMGLKVAEYRVGEQMGTGSATFPAYKMSSGTSYSSPLVAGIAARYLQSNPSASPSEVWDWLRDGATTTSSTGGSLILEPPGSGRSDAVTIPASRMVHLRDHSGGSCRLRPVRRVSITKQPASWTLPSGSQVSLTVETDEWADYQWYRGASGDMSQPVWGATGSSFVIPPLATTTPYWVHVIGETNSVQSDAATITLGSCPGISIQSQPQSADVLQGQSLTLSVAASSVNPVTYQWYAGGTPIPNSNTPSITVTPMQQTNYRVVMTNGCRTVYSSWAYVRVVEDYLVAFRTYYSNYIGADNCGGSGVHATAGLPYECERFVLRDLNGGQLLHGDYVTLRSYSGHYVVAEWGGGPGQTVNANRTAAGPWETFQILNMDGGSLITSTQNVALKTSGGYFVVAEYGGINGGGPGAGDVNCDRTQAAQWETFEILWQ